MNNLGVPDDLGGVADLLGKTNVESSILDTSYLNLSNLDLQIISKYLDFKDFYNLLELSNKSKNNKDLKYYYHTTFDFLNIPCDFIVPIHEIKILMNKLSILSNLEEIILNFTTNNISIDITYIEYIFKNYINFHNIFNHDDKHTKIKIKINKPIKFDKYDWCYNSSWIKCAISLLSSSNIEPITICLSLMIAKDKNYLNDELYELIEKYKNIKFVITMSEGPKSLSAPVFSKYHVQQIPKKYLSLNNLYFGVYKYANYKKISINYFKISSDYSIIGYDNLFKIDKFKKQIIVQVYKFVIYYNIMKFRNLIRSFATYDNRRQGSENFEKITYYKCNDMKPYKFSYDEIKQLNLNGFIDKVHYNLNKINYIVYDNNIFYIRNNCLLKLGASSDICPSDLEHEYLRKFRYINDYVNHYEVAELRHIRLINDIKNYYNFKLLYC